MSDNERLIYLFKQRKKKIDIEKRFLFQPEKDQPLYSMILIFIIGFSLHNPIRVCFQRVCLNIKK